MQQICSLGANANAFRRGQGQQRNSSDAISSSHWTRDSRTDMSFCVHSSNHVPPPIPSLDMARQRGICARVITCHTILYNLVIATSFSESSFYFNLNQISAKYFFAQNTYKSFLICFVEQRTTADRLERLRDKEDGGGEFFWLQRFLSRFLCI